MHNLNKQTRVKVATLTSAIFVHYILYVSVDYLMSDPLYQFIESIFSNNKSKDFEIWFYVLMTSHQNFNVDDMKVRMSIQVFAEKKHICIFCTFRWTYISGLLHEYWWILSKAVCYIQEKFEDAKGFIRSHQSTEDVHKNGQNHKQWSTENYTENQSSSNMNPT